MKRGLNVFDNFLPDPQAYMDSIRGVEYRTFEFPEATFHGICPMDNKSTVPYLVKVKTGGEPWLSFLRNSPVGQVEPHFIHTDIDMGKWSALLYLNRNPPDGDGTSFWTHNDTGSVECLEPHLYSKQGQFAEGWTLRETVDAAFNRLIVFPASYFHSRAIFGNWTMGDESRLTQVTFGKGDIFT